MQTLTGLQEQVQNNAWGISNVKDVNAQTQADIAALKQRQQQHNDTLATVSQ